LGIQFHTTKLHKLYYPTPVHNYLKETFLWASPNLLTRTAIENIIVPNVTYIDKSFM